MGDTATAAELEMEQLEEEDIMDFLHSKGSLLDAFRREYLDLQKVCSTIPNIAFACIIYYHLILHLQSSDMTLAINTGKEREVDVLNQEYKVFRTFSSVFHFLPMLTLHHSLSNF